MASSPVGGQPSGLSIQMHVLQALMLRDMRTRFGGSHWGYIVAVVWPCAHIFVLVAILTFRGLQSPLGGNVILFVATGTTPYITFMYMSRKVMEGVGMNKPLIYFPRVSLYDVIISRVIVEVITAFATTLCVIAALMALQVDVVPVYPTEALFAYFVTILISVGMGIINANIIVYFPGWAMGYILLIIGGYSTSGVFFVPEYMPAQVYNVLSWNPVLHCVSWFRSAFYPHYGEDVAKLYALGSGFVLVAVGLMLERFVTRHRMTSN